MKKDYTKYSFLITALVIVIMIGVSFIPPLSFGNVQLKRANIFSDLYKFDDSQYAKQEEVNEEDQAFIDEMERIAEQLASDSTDLTDTQQAQAQDTAEPSAAIAQQTWEVEGTASENRGNIASVSIGEGESIVPIEDYYGNGDSRVTIADFCELLGSATNSRVVRVAFLGDSYIEGDIITADVRDQLQEAYGGGGVGFLPFSTPLAQNRPTIKHTYSGWTNYNLIKKSSAPASVRDRFFVSGIVSAPAAGAKSTYSTTNFRPHLKDANTARIIFTNQGHSTELAVNINDSIDKVFALDSSDVVQQLKVAGVNIQKLKVTVNKPENFYGYGVVMESGRGVSVDNYSIRGNSGLALFGTTARVNAEIDRQLGYDLIVIQYGLNVMQAGVNKYTKYGEQLRKIINYVKACFPNSAVVVFGVGDRSTLSEGVYVSMPAVKGMIAEQRAAAQECGVAFWDMCEAMGGPGSMSSYVRKGWAAKDYTHLSFQGGRQIATEFVKALASFKETSVRDMIRELEIEDSIALGNIYDPFLMGDSSGYTAADSLASAVRDSVGGVTQYSRQSGIQNRVVSESEISVRGESQDSTVVSALAVDSAEADEIIQRDSMVTSDHTTSFTHSEVDSVVIADTPTSFPHSEADSVNSAVHQTPGANNNLDSVANSNDILDGAVDWTESPDSDNHSQDTSLVIK